MAVRYKTPFIPNEIYFITFTVLGWKNVFKRNKYCNLVYKWFDYMRANYGNKVHGYVIVPNHIHILLHISANSPELPILIFNAKKFLAFGIRNLLQEDNKLSLLNFFAEKKTKAKANYRFFEPRYDSLIIQTEKFFLEKLNYIHKNPCAEHWRLTGSPEDYEYSSASNYFFGKGMYDVDLIDF
jgi:putative transposase